MAHKLQGIQVVTATLVFAMAENEVEREDAVLTDNRESSRSGFRGKRTSSSLMAELERELQRPQGRPDPASLLSRPLFNYMKRKTDMTSDDVISTEYRSVNTSRASIHRLRDRGSGDGVAGCVGTGMAQGCSLALVHCFKDLNCRRMQEVSHFGRQRLQYTRVSQGLKSNKNFTYWM